jgi:hypothetical protein
MFTYVSKYVLSFWIIYATVAQNRKFDVTEREFSEREENSRGYRTTESRSATIPYSLKNYFKRQKTMFIPRASLNKEK